MPCHVEVIPSPGLAQLSSYLTLRDGQSFQHCDQISTFLSTIVTMPPASYASFRVDPSINFDNFNLGWDENLPSPVVSNFSRPISFRPVLSPNQSQYSFAPSDSSRRSSYVSSKGPMTPKQETPPPRESVIASKPRIATPEDDPVTLSFMTDSKSPKLDLSFAVESVMRTYQPLSTPSRPSSPIRPTTASGKARPLTAIDLDLAQKMKPCPVHGVRKSIASPSISNFAPSSPRVSTSSFKPPCPVHGVKSPSSALSGAPTFPDSRKSIGEGPPRKSMSEQPSRKSMGERPPAFPVDSTQSLPSLPFLKHDPFAPQDSEKARPKSAGVGAARSDDDDVDFVFNKDKKQSAPSIMSTRSTRSIRKGFSRVRRLLTRGS